MHWASDSQLQFAVWLFFFSCLFVFVLFASAPVKQYYKIVSASFWEQVRLWFRWHLRIFLHSPSSLLPLQPDGTWLRPVGNGFRAGTFPWSAAEVCRGQSYNTRENWWNWKDCCGLLWTVMWKWIGSEWNCQEQLLKKSIEQHVNCLDKTAMVMKPIQHGHHLSANGHLVICEVHLTAVVLPSWRFTALSAWNHPFNIL